MSNEYYDNVILKVILFVERNDAERGNVTKWLQVPKSLKKSDFDPVSGELLHWNHITDRIKIDVSNAYWRIESITLQKCCDALSLLDE